MYFVQATQAPISVTLADGRVLSVPKLTLRQMGQWASEISDARHAQEIEGLSDLQKREHARFYPKAPPTTGELRGLVRTIQGIEKIVSMTFSKAGLSSDEISEILDSNGVGTFEALAAELADLDDTSQRRPVAATVDSEEAKKEESDPTD
jgi:hypothetical protein